MREEYFMEIAIAQAERALLGGEFPVGCVIADEKKVIATGVRKGTAGSALNEVDHAEMVALRSLCEQKLPIEKKELTIYSTMEPCLMCFGAIILSGIQKIVYAYEDVMGGGAGCNLVDLKPLYRDARITIVPNILREKSLLLFKKFFNNPTNEYWKNSFLAQYTLDQ
ncbi:MAG: tRNA-specific adenosine deaminase [Desulfobacterium sp.]|nr:tRNA-specific adenosine deaminase [Desulfobacterium sp.]